MTETGTVRYGAWRQSANIAADAVGSIHHDATAESLGMRGGTVAGSIHMEQFQRLLEDGWGTSWWREGTLSLFFLHATTDRESVRCACRLLGDGRADVWMETADGTRVAEGTASLGPDPDSALRRRLAQVRPPADLRMLADVKVGDIGEVGPVRVPADDVPFTADRLGARLEGRVVPANRLIDLFRLAEPAMVSVRGPYVGLYGALEIETMDGVPRAEIDYRVTGRVLALSESPKTEVIWYEATLHAEDQSVARHLHMSRLMKASSPLWA